MTEEEKEDFEDLQSDIKELEICNKKHARINRELIEGLPKTPYRESIRLASEVPLLWGRGNFSLGYSISQHILSLINEHNPDWGFKVLPRQEIEKLIKERGYVYSPMRFSPQPVISKMLKIWARKLWNRNV